MADHNINPDDTPADTHPPLHISECEMCEQQFLTANEWAHYCLDCINDLKGHHRGCI